MINKTFRLSNGFWHKFLPNSNKLFSPQNIQIEIWDIDKQVKEGKFHPGIFCIKNIAVSNNGDKFVFRGGCKCGESIFKIYEVETLNCIGEFTVMEECCNPVFVNDDQALLFGTWEGNIYSYNFHEKISQKTFSLENCMFTLINNGKHNDIIYMSACIKASEKNNFADPFIMEYNIKENIGKRIDFSEEYNARLHGLALNKNKLAIMSSIYAGKENDRIVHESKLYIYDVDTKIVKIIKENFRIRDVFYDLGTVVWSKDGKLAFIGLDEIYIMDIENNFENVIKFERATSVEFSNCGTGIAVGGSKAKLYKI
jgi:WD40 repeat protein